MCAGGKDDLDHEKIQYENKCIFFFFFLTKIFLIITFDQLISTSFPTSGSNTS